MIEFFGTLILAVLGGTAALMIFAEAVEWALAKMERKRKRKNKDA